MDVVNWISGQGRAVLDAPLVYGLTVLVVFGVCWKLAAYLHEREIASLKASNELKNDRIDELKTETDRQAQKIAELQNRPSLSPAERLSFSSNAMQSVVIPVIRSQQPVRFKGRLPELSEEARKNLSIFIRAEELGAARLEEQTIPAQVTAYPSLSASDVVMITLKWPDDKKSGDG